MSDTPRKKAHVTSSFTDVGTGESFAAGDTPLIEAGAFGNYEAAGLVSAHSTEKSKAPAKAKPTKSRTAKAKSATAPTPVAEPVAPVDPAPHEIIAPSE